MHWDWTDLRATLCLVFVTLLGTVGFILVGIPTPISLLYRVSGVLMLAVGSLIFTRTIRKDTRDRRS